MTPAPKLHESNAPANHADALARILRDCLDLGPLHIDVRHGGRRVTLRVEDGAGVGTAAAPADPDYHTDNFRCVISRGVTYHLTDKQAIIIGVLYEAARRGQPDVGQQDLLRAADSDSIKVNDLFRRSTAWNNLIVSTYRGLYRWGGVMPESGVPS